MIHRITQERKDGKERSIDDIEELCKVTAYSLSHAGLASKNSGEHHAEAHPFGEVANFEAFDAAKADVNDAMRRVAGTVLGEDFGKRECTEQVPDGPDHDDSGDGDHAGVRSLGVPASSGSGSGGSGSKSLVSGGGSGGFASALAADADTGTWDATEGSVPPSLFEPTPEETSTCAGNLAPIWTADECLGDLGWITRIEDRFGEERVHELRKARREWKDMGKPVPETP